MNLGDQKSRVGRPATGKGVPVQVRMPPDLLAALDTFLARDGSVRSRPDAVRHALADWLAGHGYLRHREDPEGAN